MSAPTVILGSGIVGLSTAYYLSRSGSTKPQDIYLVDPIPKLFQCSSGLAGGFLAADWFAPSVASLGTLSFKLHKELADQNDGAKRWGYSQSTGISLSQDAEDAVGGSGEDWLRDGTSRAQAAGQKPALGANGPAWLKRAEGATMEVISRDGSTGQIDPWRFCQFLLDECLKKGVQLHQPAKAISVSRDESGQLNGVRISKDGQEAELPCTRLVIAAGAWSPRVFTTLFPKTAARIPIAHLAGHSLLVKNPFYSGEAEDTSCHAVFATDTLGFSPEIFSRAGGEVFLAGLNSTMIPLPELATEAKIVPESMTQLKDCAAAMIGNVQGKDLEVMREALCFRPVTSSGRPIVARIPDAKLGTGLKTKSGAQGGVYMAAGHGAWGIAQAPGTGLCLAELMEGRDTSANIKALTLP
ncbi:FAD dependent oxidoreductase-like protein superfamily [Polyplosphaeria fusca]|uniref:FAD dependent oxidoreductase-like protein superfamily n=1 Tax=Polyplosphaeria fusca TaxID=682080 RepID=A0A9P4QK50_9PLEO|nr:FAD dependent oxidoreductase-like protein superfamily [Polyplosphaeria fusca]